MTDAELDARIEAAVRRALEPLEAELRSLRAELGLARGEAPAQPPLDVAPPAAPFEAPAPEAPPPASVPAERSDFARMIARGLEAEARQSEEGEGEKADREPPKRGWNPFKR